MNFGLGMPNLAESGVRITCKLKIAGVSEQTFLLQVILTIHCSTNSLRICFLNLKITKHCFINRLLIIIIIRIRIRIINNSSKVIGVVSFVIHFLFIHHKYFGGQCNKHLLKGCTACNLPKITFYGVNMTQSSLKPPNKFKLLRFCLLEMSA